MFRYWCDQAALPNRSAHGVRKAVGGLLAEAGCTEHQIMAILAHVEARTTEKYTKSAARAALALDGMQALRSLEW